MKPPKIILAGGSGFLGRVLQEHWKNDPVELVVLTRNPPPPTGNVRPVYWDGQTLGPWATDIDGAAAVINLAGRSVDCRYNPRNKQEILRSRLDSTAILGQAIQAADQPPALWINAASATIYRHALDRPMDEETGEIEDDFSVQVCKAWEQTFWQAQTPRTRRVCLRTALVLGRQGGVFPVLSQLASLGLGGTMGPGDQYVSWLHERDFARLIEFIRANAHLTGTFNASAPAPVRNRELMRLLRNACGMKLGLPATEWMLEVGAFFLRTETELVLKSRNVIPVRLTRAGFRFAFPDPASAIRNLARPEAEMVAPGRQLKRRPSAGYWFSHASTSRANASERAVLP